MGCKIACCKRNLGLPTGFASFEGISGSDNDAILQLRPNGIRIDFGWTCPGMHFKNSVNWRNPLGVFLFYN